MFTGFEDYKSSGEFGEGVNSTESTLSEPTGIRLREGAEDTKYTTRPLLTTT